MNVNEIFDEVLLELNRSTLRYGNFHSTHEGYAVIKEEVDELWDQIKLKQPLSAQKDQAIQIGAMVFRYILDLCND